MTDATAKTEAENPSGGATVVPEQMAWDSRARRMVTIYLPLACFVIILLFPFYWGFITSLKFEKEIFDFTGNILWVRNPSLANYETLFKTPRFARWLWNTSIVSVVTTAVSVVV